jgi:hypothetical protein
MALEVPLAVASKEGRPYARVVAFRVASFGLPLLAARCNAQLHSDAGLTGLRSSEFPDCTRFKECGA